MLIKSVLQMVLAISTLAVLTSGAYATFVFHYDPDTGNVSFDTRNTRSGALYNYNLSLNSRPGGMTFRVENHVTLGQGLVASLPDYLSETTFTNPWRGVFTIGDVLPAGLTEGTWTNLFYSDSVYVDIIGGGKPPSLEFAYGRPDVEFDNRWDLVDPDDLDWADQAQLIYQQMTGELKLVTSSGDAGGHISGFIFQSDNAFQSENFTKPFENPLSSANAGHIGFFADAMEPGEYNLGNVLPAGLTAEEYYATITKAEFFGQAGFGSDALTLGTDGAPMDLIFQAVPEPSSLALLIVCVLSLTYQRRRLTIKW